MSGRRCHERWEEVVCINDAQFELASRGTAIGSGRTQIQVEVAARTEELAKKFRRARPDAPCEWQPYESCRGAQVAATVVQTRHR